MAAHAKLSPLELAKRLKENGGYRRVGIDAVGEIFVEVDDNKYDYDMHHLYRRVWGATWPIVRSSYGEFRSHDY